MPYRTDGHNPLPVSRRGGDARAMLSKRLAGGRSVRILLTVERGIVTRSTDKGDLMKRMIFAALAAIAWTVASAAGPAAAADADPVLTVAGKSYDIAALQQMPKVEITTTSAWTDGKTKFGGVSAKALLQAAGALGTTVKATALDDYAIEIPREDFEKAIIAYEMDGAPLDEQFGPYWIIYDYDSGLDDETHQGRSVYKLKALDVK
jgi:hypothetical protein